MTCLPESKHYCSDESLFSVTEHGDVFWNRTRLSPEMQEHARVYSQLGRRALEAGFTQAIMQYLEARDEGAEAWEIARLKDSIDFVHYALDLTRDI